MIKKDNLVGTINSAFESVNKLYGSEEESEGRANSGDQDRSDAAINPSLPRVYSPDPQSPTSPDSHAPTSPKSRSPSPECSDFEECPDGPPNTPTRPRDIDEGNGHKVTSESNEAEDQGSLGMNTRSRSTQLGNSKDNMVRTDANLAIRTGVNKTTTVSVANNNANLPANSSTAPSTSNTTAHPPAERSTTRTRSQPWYREAPLLYSPISTSAQLPVLTTSRTRSRGQPKANVSKVSKPASQTHHLRSSASKNANSSNSHPPDTTSAGSEPSSSTTRPKPPSKATTTNLSSTPSSAQPPHSTSSKPQSKASSMNQEAASSSGKAPSKASPANPPATSSSSKLPIKPSAKKSLHRLLSTPKLQPLHRHRHQLLMFRCLKIRHLPNLQYHLHVRSQLVQVQLKRKPDKVQDAHHLNPFALV